MGGDQARPSLDHTRAHARRRWVLYGLSVAVLGALVWGGFLWKPEADIGTLINAAEIQIKVGLYAEGLVVAKRALALDPDDGYANLLAATAHQGLGQWDDALARYARAEQAYPDAERRRAIRVAALGCVARAGRHDDVERGAAALLEGSHSEDPDVRMILGASREDRGDIEGAIAAYEGARVDGAVPAPHLFASAAVLAGAGRTSVAIERLERGLATENRAAPAWILLARLRLEAGADDEAVRAIARAADLDLLRAREEVRRTDLWNPLREREVLAPLFAARGPGAKN